MTFETFSGPTIRDAKKRMYDKLGNVAVILATRHREDGQIEIRAIRKGTPLFEGEGSKLNQVPSAAVPPPAPHMVPKLPPRGLAARRELRQPLGAHRHQNANVMQTPRRASFDGTGLHARIEQQSATIALQALRGDFTQKLGGTQPDDPLLVDYRAKLGRHGVCDELICALAKEAKNALREKPKAALEYALERVVKFSPLVLDKQRPIMLLGQTGAGKTSSAAKIAARAAKAFQKVGFLTADVGRAGAMDQMMTYAEALDTRFWIVEGQEDIKAIVYDERPEEILVLDTPGVSPFAPADIAAMRTYQQALSAEPVLVLPASGDTNEHIDWAKAFRDIGVQRCIITKFDTSRRVGAAVSAAYKQGLALAHFSETPFIADGMVDATAKYLANRLWMEEPSRIARAI